MADGVLESSSFSPGKVSRAKKSYQNPTLIPSIKRKIDERLKEEDRRENQNGITRRQFLIGAAGVAGTAILAKSGLIDASVESSTQPKATSSATPAENISPMLPAITPKAETTLNFIDNLNEILSLPLKSPQRIQKEFEYFELVKQISETDQAIKLKAIDQGLETFSTIGTRALLLDLRYQHRNQENSNLTKLSPAQEAWVKARKIHPEVLGLCLDAEKKARGVIAALLTQKGGVKNFRPDLVRLQQFNNPKAVNPETLTIPNMMINPGGMSQLVCYETGLMLSKDSISNLAFSGFTYGFSFIGGKQAISEINPQAFPTAIPALSELCTLLKNDTGLNYTPQNIPGSEWGNKGVNISGGAIGLQFMPNKALELYHLLSQVNVKFNPFNPESALIGAWIFLARGELVGNNEVRYGYLRGDKEKIMGAIAKWNPLSDQINKIYNTAADYYDNFGS